MEDFLSDARLNSAIDEVEAYRIDEVNLYNRLGRPIIENMCRLFYERVFALPLPVPEDEYEDDDEWNEHTAGDQAELSQGEDATSSATESKEAGNDTALSLERKAELNALADRRLRGLFVGCEDRKDELVEHLTTFLVQRLGGPTTYRQTRGMPSLVARHATMWIKPSVAEAWLHQMTEAMQAAQLDADSMTRLKSYFLFTAYTLVSGSDHSTMATQQEPLPLTKAEQDAAGANAKRRERPPLTAAAASRRK